MKQYAGAKAKGYEAARRKQAKWKWEDTTLRKVLARLGGEVQSVIDAPVGTGRFLSLYTVPVVGYDASADMLDVARDSHKKAVLHKLDLVGEVLPESADLVVSVRFLNLLNTPDALKALGHLLAAARKYALFTCRTYYGGCEYSGPTTVGRVTLHGNLVIMDAMLRAGFEMVERYNFHDKVPGQYDFILVRRS